MIGIWEGRKGREKGGEKGGREGKGIGERREKLDTAKKIPVTALNITSISANGVDMSPIQSVGQSVCPESVLWQNG